MFPVTRLLKSSALPALNRRDTIISIYSELAQEEKRILSERIKSGLVNARHKGKQIGRPEGKQEDEVLLKKYSRLAADLRKGLSLSQCQKLHDVSRNTAIKVKRILS